MTVLDAFNDDVLNIKPEQEFHLMQIKGAMGKMERADLEKWLLELARLWYKQQNIIKHLMVEEVNNDFSRITESST